jgi:hypothetical protein
MTFGRRALVILALLPLTFVAAAVPLSSARVASAQSAPDEQTEPDQEAVKHSWALGPTGSSDPSQPGNRQSLTYDVAPGSTIQDSVTLYNFGNIGLPFRIYATDAYNKTDGQLELLEGDVEPADVGSWVEVAEERIAVQAGMQVTIPITITVPADARPGDHVGAVLASSPTKAVSEDGVTVDIDRRTGPDLLVRVQGPLDPKISVEGLSASYSPSLNPLSGSAEVTYRLHNSGNVRMAGTHYVTMGGPFGLGEARTEPVELTGLLPGGTIEVTVPVDGVPASVVSTASVHVDTSPVDGVGDSSSTSTEASARTLALPVSVIALVLIVALVLFARSRYMRRGRASGPSPLGPGGRRPPGLPSPPGGAGTSGSRSASAPVLERQR